MAGLKDRLKYTINQPVSIITKIQLSHPHIFAKHNLKCTTIEVMSNMCEVIALTHFEVASDTIMQAVTNTTESE